MRFRFSSILLPSALLLALPSISLADQSNSTAPDFYSLGWTYAHKFGIPGTIVFVTFLVWWRWDTIRKLPFLGWLISRSRNFLSLNQLPRPLPTADPNRFSVIVNRFKDDQNDGYAELLVNALAGLDGIQALALEEPINADSSRPSDAIQFGHESARELLKRTQAQILIWGRVITVDGKSGIQIFWTTSSEGRRSPELHQLEGLKLPERFWIEFVGVIQLQIVAESTEFFAREGQFVADRLRPFIEKIQRLLADPVLGGWDENSRARVRLILAGGHRIYGEQAGNNTSLQSAIGLYLEVLKTWNREREPLGWAMIQRDLGTAFALLGEHDNRATLLERAGRSFL